MYGEDAAGAPSTLEPSYRMWRLLRSSESPTRRAGFGSITSDGCGSPGDNTARNGNVATLVRSGDHVLSANGRRHSDTTAECHMPRGLPWRTFALRVCLAGHEIEEMKRSVQVTGKCLQLEPLSKDACAGELTSSRPQCPRCFPRHSDTSSSRRVVWVEEGCPHLGRLIAD